MDLNITPSADASASNAELELVGVGRRYGQAWAVRDVSLAFPRGRCTALIGENGAGKSTLLRILCGLVHPSQGHVTIDAEITRIRGPRDAEKRGIAIIPQELAYVPHLTVAENIVMGRWPHHGGVISQRSIQRHAEKLVSRVGFSLQVNRYMRDLSLAERQLVEFVKVLVRDARIILLDEPTAALTEIEANRLLAMLEQLKAAGKTLVYVSHRLDECFRVSDYIAVMRDGRLVHQAPAGETSPREVLRAMLGTRGPETEGADSRPDADLSALDPILEAIDWQCDSIPVLRGASFAVARGEILGLFGLVGSGIETVARGLGGHEGRIRGGLVVGGVRRKPFSRPHDARRASVGYVPAERKTEGLALVRPIRDNLSVQVLQGVQRFGFVRSRAETKTAERLVRDFGITCRNLDQATVELSGGNQQKVLLASRVAASPRILVLHEPTRGVDVGARAQIHALLRRLATGGTAVVVITSDVAEAVAVSDRLIVMRGGAVVGRFAGPSKTRANVLAAATHVDGSGAAVTKTE